MKRMREKERRRRKKTERAGAFPIIRWDVDGMGQEHMRHTPLGQTDGILTAWGETQTASK